MSNARIAEILDGLISDQPEQNKAIKSLAPLTVVSAGAGTGKTQTLSQRVAYLLASDETCEIEQILVLTFTEKAAREMQDRIKKTICEWHKDNQRELASLKKAIDHIDDACISTLHSFAMKVIRESGLNLDLDPSAQIAPAPMEDVWWKTFADALGTMSCGALKRLFDAESDDGMKWIKRIDGLFEEEALSELVSAYDPNTLSEAAKTASEKLGSLGKTAEYLFDEDMSKDGSPLLTDVKSYQAKIPEIWGLWWDEIFALPDICEELYKDKAAAFNIRLREIHQNFSSAEPTDENMLEFVKKLLTDGIGNLQGTGNSKLKKNIDELLPEGMTLGTWRDEAKLILLMASAPSDEELALIAMLNRICAVGWECWDRLRRRDGVLSMNDLIRYAAEVLERDPAYGGQFKHILVDEFQDTDGLQDKMIQSLWREGENTLFVVGDLKQSIYRFRHADLTIFQGYIDMAKNSPEKYCYVTLDKSFRTRGVLLERFNKIFGEMWEDGIEDKSMEYEELRCPETVKWWQERNSCQIDPVMPLLMPVEERELNETKKKDSQWVSAEKPSDMKDRLYGKIAERISVMCRDKAKVWGVIGKDDNDKDKYGFRPVQLRDFALLVPTRTAYPLIERAFRAANLPFVLCTSKSYFTRGEVSDLVNLISLLASPNSSEYLAGWLASPFSGAEVGDAARFMAEASAMPRGEEKTVLLAEYVRANAPEVWRRVEELRTVAELRGVSQMLLEIMENQGYLRSYDSDQRAKVNANISKLADLAAEYEMSQGRSFSGCADYLRFSVNEAQQKEEPDIADEDLDAVKVLTIHASKGLEYPIVILTGADVSSVKISGICISPRYGVVVKKLPDYLRGEDSSIPENTVSGAWYAETEKQKELAEKERLWYVAATRARDSLMICGLAMTEGRDGGSIKPPKPESFLGHVLAADEDETLFKREYIRKENAANIKYHYAKAENDGGPMRERRLSVVSPATLGRLSATVYALLRWCPKAYRITYRQGRSMQWASQGADETGGSDFGTLAHWVLARWNFKKESIEFWLPDENPERYSKALASIPVECREEFREKRSRGSLVGLLSDFADWDECDKLAELARTKKLNKETSFRVLDDDLLMVGATDMYWEDGHTVYLRDWKTTREDITPEYYEFQLEFYAYAIWKHKGCPSDLSVDAGLYYLRERECRRKLFKGGDFVKFGDEIHVAATEALSGVFNKAESRCSSCPWSKECGKK